MNTIQLNCSLAPQYYPFHREPEHFTINEDLYNELRIIIDEFPNIGFKDTRYQSLILQDEIAFFMARMSEHFANISYKEDTELRDEEARYYITNNRKRDVKSFFNLPEICNSTTIGQIDIIDNRSGKTSFNSPELISFVLEAIAEKFERAKLEQSDEYLRFNHEREILDENMIGRNILGTLRSDRTMFAFDLIRFVLNNLNLIVHKQIFRFCAKVCFVSNFPFFIGRGKYERGLHDTWDHDLINHFENIIYAMPTPYEKDDWSRLQFQLIQLLPDERKDDALTKLISKL